MGRMEGEGEEEEVKRPKREREREADRSIGGWSPHPVPASAEDEVDEYSDSTSDMTLPLSSLSMLSSLMRLCNTTARARGMGMIAPLGFDLRIRACSAAFRAS